MGEVSPTEGIKLWPPGGVYLSLARIVADQFFLDLYSAWRLLRCQSYHHAFPQLTVFWLTLFLMIKEIGGIRNLKQEVDQIVRRGIQSDRFLELVDREKGIEGLFQLMLSSRTVNIGVFTVSDAVLSMGSCVSSVYS